jgi:enoyl-CoA hydratase
MAFSYDLPDELRLQCDGGVRLVTLNRPEQANAAGSAMLWALTELTRQLALDEEAGAVIITGAGRAFSAGGDFQHFVRTAREADYARAALDNSRRFVEGMLALPMPVIAAVNGAAVGFGATLLALSDLVLISDRAYISDPHVDVGLVVGDGIAATWPLYMSLLRAKEYIYTGERIAPEQAVALGLANRVVPHEQLPDEARALAEKLCRRPRQALRGTKQILNLHLQQSAERVLGTLLERQFAQTQGPEHGSIVEQLIERQKQRRAERGGSA